MILVLCRVLGLCLGGNGHQHHRAGEEFPLEVFEERIDRFTAVLARDPRPGVRHLVLRLSG